MINEKTQDFVNKATAYLQSQLPVIANGKSFNIEGLTFVPPTSLDDIGQQLSMKYNKKGSVLGYIKGKIVIKNESDGKIIDKSGLQNIVPVYCITDRGTYMINGSDKTMLSSMRRKPGVYTSFKQGAEVRSDMNFKGTSARMAFTYNRATQSDFKAVINNNNDFDGVGFLRALGFNDSEIVKAMGNDNVADFIMSSAKGYADIKAIYKALTTKDAKGETPDEVRAELFEYFSNRASFGDNTTVKQTLKSSDDHVTKDVIIKAVKKLFDVSAARVTEDDIDDLRFKEIKGDNDILMDQFKIDVNDFLVDAKEKLNTESGNAAVNYVGSMNRIKKGINSIFLTSDNRDHELIQNADGTNPIDIISNGRKVTQTSGNGAIRNKENVVDQRKVKAMGFNRIDPVETPESGDVGLTERVSSNAKIEDNTIKIAVYKVFGGKVNATDSNIKYLTPTEEYDSKVAYFDSDYVKREGNKIVFLKDSVLGRYHGKDQMMHVSEVQYIDKSAQGLFSFSANLIPFVNHDDGNRALMGTNMQRQAMDLKNKEVPLVQTSMDGTGTTYEKYIGENYGKPIRSAVDGTVASITKTNIVIKGNDGKTYSYPYYRYFNTSQGAFINNELKVKKGDTVSKGQMLADGWQTKDGNLATGVNARVGYLAYKGYNYEDGIVISKSFANKMSAESMTNEEVRIKEGCLGGRGSNIQSELKAYTTDPAILSKLDRDGLAKEGDTVKPGDVLAVILEPTQGSLLGSLSASPYKLKKFEIPKTAYTEGRIERINVVDNPGSGLSQKIVFTIIASKPMQLGDKVAGKHGNKGTITKILDDDEMPVAEDGVRLDILYSPLAIPSRKNVGQIYEAGAGLIAEKTGKPFVVNNFDKNEKNRVIEGLKKIGVPGGKMKVTLKERQADGSIVDVETENPVTVGNMYMLRLNKLSDDKLQARDNEQGRPQFKNYMPGKTTGNSAGDKHNPQSLGEMELRALQSHGAVWNILESTTIKADGGGDVNKRIEIFNALKDGKFSNLEGSATPESLKLTQKTLRGLGLELKPYSHGKEAESLDDVYDSLRIMPIKSSEFIKTVGKKNEVTNGKLFRGKITAGKESEAVKGGLYDPAIFGEPNSIEGRNKWGYIKLHTPTANPLLMEGDTNPYAILTGQKTSDLKALSTGKKVYIIDPDKYEGEMVKGPNSQERRNQYRANMEAAGLKPGDIIDAKKLDDLADKYGDILWKAGGESILFMLDQIDVKKELKEAKKQLDAATKPSEINDCYKKFKTLDTLRKNRMTASDLMMNYVPVTPTYMRPMREDGKSVVTDDTSKLYSRLLTSNELLKNSVTNGTDIISSMDSAEGAGRDAGNVYKSMRGLFAAGTDKADQTETRTGVVLKGLFDSVKGKTGLIRGSLLSKRVDFSGRAVIGVDPSLKLNEVAIPADMARYVYKPFILKELIDKGDARNIQDAEEKWSNMDGDTLRAMRKVTEDRPVLLNRQPSLHAQSIMAYKPVIKETQDGAVARNIQLNPLTVTGFNADFDGDQMSIHVPITERAREEANRLMKPTSNMILSKNGNMTFEIRQEMVLGVYYLTKDVKSPIGDEKKYMSYDSLKKDWQNGKIHTNQMVSISGLTGVTAGYALFILLIPPTYRPNIVEAFDNKALKKLFKDMYADCEESNGKNISKAKIANIMDDVKALGFEASTKSGVSIGIGDFEKVDDIKKLYDKAEKESDDPVEVGLTVAGAIEKKIKDRTAFKKKNNAMDIIFQSGAKGKADQYRKIIGTVGLGVGVEGNPTVPVKSSFVEGLAPSEYYTLSADSRKGVYDRSVATAAPGAFTRDVYSGVQDQIIKETDCGSTDGILIRNGDSQIVGRTAASDIISKKGEVIVKRNTTITKRDYDKIYKDDSIIDVKVRSPLRCKCIGGVCQKCYGTMPGTTRFPEIGAPIGVIASQSFGEPFTQGILNTFHSGGAGAGAKASGGLARVKKTLGTGGDDLYEAVLANLSGQVTDIQKGAAGTFDTVFINGKPHKIPHINGMALPLRVKKGDTVIKGDFLTKGNTEDIRNNMHIVMTGGEDPEDTEGFTFGSVDKLYSKMSDVMSTDEAKNKTQDFMLASLGRSISKAVGRDAIDSRHMEVVLNKMTSKAKILDPGTSNFLKGSVVDKNEIDKWNAEMTGPYSAKSVPITSKMDLLGKVSAVDYKDKRGNIVVKKGQLIDEPTYSALMMANVPSVKVKDRPIEYANEIGTISTINNLGNENFFSNMGTENIKDKIQKAVVFGQEDKLNDPRGRLMTGKLLNIGEGFKVPRSIADSLTTKIKNLFDK